MTQKKNYPSIRFPPGMQALITGKRLDLPSLVKYSKERQTLTGVSFPQLAPPTAIKHQEKISSYRALAQG
jgi:hypothetical protein